MSEPDPEGREADGSGARDAASVLPVLAILLLTPPLVLIFTAPVRVAGVPLIVVYIFGLWAAIVAVAAFLARRLERAGAPEPPHGGDGRS